ncbi:MAG: hypothetical protein ACTHOU_06915 [Aureliella sp.]|jgi:hypothetical protein
MNRPSRLLFGQTLAWVTYDPERTVSAALRWMLREALAPQDVQLAIVEATSAEVAGSLVEQHAAGLMTLVLAEEDWPGGCRALRRVQLRRSRTLRCVYLPSPAPLDRLPLLEAGAQIVADQIPWLQRLVPKIVERAPRKSGGNHPITSGLVDRLPWTD